MKNILNRPLMMVLIVNFIGMFAYSIVLPLLPYYANPLQVGFVFSIYSLCQFFATPIIGSLSDRQGRKLWLSASLFGTAVGKVEFI